MVIIVRYLNPLTPVTKNPAKTRNADRNSAEQFNFKNVKFLICKRD